MLGDALVTLTSAQLAPLVSAGAVRASGTVALNSPPDAASGWFFQGLNADGLFGLWLDAPNRALKLYARNIVQLTTPALTTDPAGGTFGNYIPGDIGDYSVWFDPVTGGARSMGIRWGVNGAFGFDTTGAALGAAYNALTSAYARGSTPTLWQPTSARATGPTSADVDAIGVVLGDSIMACYRADVPGTASRLLCSPGVAIATLAQPGGDAAEQLLTWQGSRYRGDSNVRWLLVQVGNVDIGTPVAAAVVLARIQAIVDDALANNPGIQVFVCTLTPWRFQMTGTMYTEWLAVNVGINGGGATPITGATIISGATAAMGDGNDNLLYRYLSTDSTHPPTVGRQVNAAYQRTAILAAGQPL